MSNSYYGLLNQLCGAADHQDLSLLVKAAGHGLVVRSVGVVQHRAAPVEGDTLSEVAQPWQGGEGPVRIAAPGRHRRHRHDEVRRAAGNISDRSRGLARGQNIDN